MQTGMYSAMILEIRCCSAPRKKLGICGWVVNRRRIGRVIMEGVARMNDGHSAIRFLSREGQNSIFADK